MIGVLSSIPGAKNYINTVSTDLSACSEFRSYLREYVSPFQIIHDIIYERTRQDEEESFYVADMGELERQYHRWMTQLPNVRPFYAVKCNSDPVVLLKMVSLGVGFDCASQKEIDSVMALGVSSNDIIFANPCKPRAHIVFARDRGVHRMTVDNEEEILKIASVNANAEIVLRILVDDSSSVCRFGVKFGMTLSTAKKLLKVAQNLCLSVIGISFHVGSGCRDPQAFAHALRSAKELFDMAPSYGFKFTLLDIGGGFPGSGTSSSITFEQIAATVRPILLDLFNDPTIEVIAEPGRFFVASAFTLTVRVNSRRVVFSDSSSNDSQLCGNDESLEKPSKFMYYVNDGVYGSFNCLVFDHAVLGTPYIVRISDPVSQADQFYESSVWGPTCDSMDCLSRNIMLPELQIGDWMTFPNMGAYTMAASSTFNGFPKSLIVYIDTEQK